MARFFDTRAPLAWCVCLLMAAFGSPARSSLEDS